MNSPLLILLLASVANGQVIDTPIFFDPPGYDERVSQASCGERTIVAHVSNRPGAAPALKSVLIDGEPVAAPDAPADEDVFARFRVIDGAEILCEQGSGAPFITFKGDSKKDDAWRKASEACTEMGGVWINQRWETYEAKGAKLYRTATLEPVCAFGRTAAAAPSKGR